MVDKSEIKSVQTKVTLKSGMSFNVGDTGEMWLPSAPLKNSYAEQIPLIRNMEIADTDILLAGYPKGGSNWMFHIFNMLLNGSSDYCNTSKPLHFLETIDIPGLEVQKSGRVLNTHLLFHQLPKQIIEKKRPIIYVLRNPKSAVVSLYHHFRDFKPIEFEGSWPQTLESFIEDKLWYGNWFDYVLDWEKAIADNPECPITVLHYEDLLKNPAGEIYKLSKAIGVEGSEQLCSQIAYACELDRLRIHGAKVDALKSL
ncbi:sulfotransferase 1C4-like isoform X2 [Gigantopelta aegis]|uniref:sulfotransferase 1C4-like isoform X2 n=1 Tax=Gigantopelta aegis TaxID=1735272 RepID=UPI001B88C86D|nr:sulfotransferase 1C4-like isoform X2 [Gigantopelta aegis]